MLRHVSSLGVARGRSAGSSPTPLSLLHHLSKTRLCARRHGPPSFQMLRLSSTSTSTTSSLLMRLQRLAVSLADSDSRTDGSSPSEPNLHISRLMDVAKPERNLIGFALVSQLVSASSTMIFPFALGRIVDTVTSSSSVAGLDSLTMTMAGVFLVSSLASASRVSAMSLAGSRISRQLRVDFFRAVLRQDTPFFDRRKSAELVNRLSADIPMVSYTLTTNLASILRNGVTALTSLGFVMYLSPTLSLVALGSVPPIATFASIFGRNSRGLSRQLVDALAAATQVAAERTSAIRTVRTFGAEFIESKRYARRVDDTYGLARQVAIADGLYAASVQLAAQMSLLGVLAFGGRMVLDPANVMTIGNLTSFSIYAVNMGVSVSAIGTAYGHLTRALGAGHRIFEVIDREPEGTSSTIQQVDNVDGATSEFPSAKYHRTGKVLPSDYEAIVRFSNVQFTYPTRMETPILKGVDLTVQPGEIVAIAGASGSGKSTISALLSRLYEPSGGDITLGGHHIDELDIAWLRQQIAVVAQEPTLFSGTITENISYAMSNDLPAERVHQAAKAAASHEMISSLPDGYETPVGERGESLSGGQRARTALARALVRKPKVLVLDEHSAALDAESERAVAQAVQTAASDLKMAVITIAHRSSSLRRADRVAVLVDGQVGEIDTYDNLMQRKDSHLRRMLVPSTLKN